MTSLRNIQVQLKSTDLDLKPIAFKLDKFKRGHFRWGGGGFAKLSLDSAAQMVIESLVFSLSLSRAHIRERGFKSQMMRMH